MVPHDAASEREGGAFGRRRFLTYLVAAPTLTVAARVAADSAASPSAAASVPSPPQVLGETVDIQDLLVMAGAPTAGLLFQIQVNEDGTVSAALPRAEVGQGLATSVPMLIAEEMDIPLSSVHMTLADARPELGMGQITGGSSGIVTLYDPARAAAAATRARLVATAAQQWGVPREQLMVTDGTVHAPDGRSAGYGSLAAAAATAICRIFLWSRSRRPSRT